ncbi:MAG: hypothetical protein HFE77_04210 [Clostridiales bacterium]|nr:hypothetical protein [Clostridiales bacterium]
MNSQKTKDLIKEAEEKLKDSFERFDEIAFLNTQKVMAAFQHNRVGDACFMPTTGYGYDDKGRETLDAVYAEVFGAPAALVRHSIVSGTQALTIGLFGLLRTGDTMLSITGKPYDTLEEVIGIAGTPGNGSLRDFGVKYQEIDVLESDGLVLARIDQALAENTNVKVVFIQRSKGYLNRRTLSVEEIGRMVAYVKERSDAYVVIDNCYGEFTEIIEPTAVGADLIIGSLIKNPGGGLAQSGGYLAGSERAVELCSYRLTSVGIGAEAGATLGHNRELFQGFFFAPHTVAQALKTAALAAYVFEQLGFEVEPRPFDRRYDIIQSVKLGSAEKLCAFCQGIQHGSPVDSFVTPEPWAMPGYQDQVIMAAGTFTQGASIELSADGPLRAPFTAYFQGGLTYESGKIGIMSAADAVLNSK